MASDPYEEEANASRAEFEAQRDAFCHSVPRDELNPSGIELEVCKDIARRQALGIAKYGTTVADNPLSLKQWLQHAFEEALDQAVYLKRAIAEIDAKSHVVESAPGREHVRYMTSEPGALPIRPGEPGYDEAPFEVMLMWQRK